MKKINDVILNLYPTTKFLFVLFVLLTAFIVPGFIYQYSLLLVALVIALLAGKPTVVNLVIKGLIPIVLIIFLLQIFFYPGENVLWSWWIFEMKMEGIQFSLVLTSRILALGSAFILYFAITPIKDFVYSLEQMGVPPKASYVVLSTLSIIPELRRTSKTIMDAQRSRGVETEGNLKVRAKAFLPTLSPLILGAISGTEERVITLEARGFTVVGKKTSLHHLEKTKNDTIVRILFGLALIIVIGWRFL
ncbi:energy-coupling factor transporter transmembrane component T [Bacillus sp. B15-48]|uniref:energy-coupling factor transporter transmembrane component T n=1 Tax=Bacillus sp. B15-48 TaxID=1548601 RepID=UPI00193F8CF4|nr:energy-coupling factor transporter transmembrane component T [Bacillus sp. B15-48]MBM4761244.1 energy-coupling factor transporter transmembrane protein EcfT [Bacillus sp. B15-48]